jgi:hypothetical protein
MDYTYLDYFNYYLKEYLSELVNTFPETRDPILANYRPLLEGTNDKNDIYAKCYYTKINNYLTEIAKKDATLFETTGKIFIEGVDLYSIWNHSDATPENRTAIWKYLQILMILGRKIMPNHKEIVDILNKVSNGDVHIPAKVEQTLATKDTDEVEDTPGVFGLGDIASSLGGLSSLANGLGLGGGGGGSGGGLSGLMSSLGLGGGGEGGGLGGLGDIGNLMNGVKDMFTNPEFTNAMNQLSQQFTPQEQGQGQDNSENSESKSSSNSDTCEGGEDDCCEHHKSQMKADGSDANTATNPMPSMFNNPLFSELASEIGSTFDFAEMEKDGKPQNIGDALGRFMSGNNPAKLMELVGKFGSKLQNEVKNGNINPADLLKQTMNAAGGPQNIEKMMSDPKVKARMSQMQAQNQGQNATRDRLRAKLDKKNAEK